MDLGSLRRPLALCMDIQAALDSGNPETYMSALAVGYDGTCSAYQHAALMTRDVHTAKAVNVIGDSESREDIYQRVGDVVVAKLTELAATSVYSDLLEATTKGYVWENNLVSKGIRDIVKRPTMTVLYGLNEHTLPSQLLEDKKVPTMDYAKALAPIIWEALESVCPMAMELRNWLRSSARVLAEAGELTQWTTPLGTVCSPKYYKYKTSRSVRILGRVTRLPDYSKQDGVIVKKLVDASSPNIVHSLDAAAVHLTAVRLAEQGISNMTFVHDQYDCSPADAAKLSVILREAHVELYSDNTLEALYAGFKELMGDQQHKLPEPPAMGDLDVEALMHSPHFFS